MRRAERLRQAIVGVVGIVRDQVLSAAGGRGNPLAGQKKVAAIYFAQTTQYMRLSLLGLPFL
jgi:hypothetical protein